MGGLFVLAFIVLYAIVAFRIARRYNASPYKWHVVVLLVLIPTADAIVERIGLTAVCAARAGRVVHRVVENVDGIYVPEFMGSELVADHGYKFVESGAGTNLVRTSRNEIGKIVDERAASPLKSSYSLEDSKTSVGPFVWDYLAVKDIRTAEVIGEDTDIYYYGGWVEWLIGDISDAGGPTLAGHCGDDYPGVRMVKVVTAALRPSK